MIEKEFSPLIKDDRELKNKAESVLAVSSKGRGGGYWKFVNCGDGQTFDRLS